MRTSFMLDSLQDITNIEEGSALEKDLYIPDISNFYHVANYCLIVTLKTKVSLMSFQITNFKCHILSVYFC